MWATLTIKQTRKTLKVEWYKPSPEQIEYIDTNYSDTGGNYPFSHSYYLKTTIRFGKYNRILDFMGEISKPGTLLYERSQYNKANGITESYSTKLSYDPIVL